jgi:phospholipid-binding lipoprotein MlaA
MSKRWWLAVAFALAASAVSAAEPSDPLQGLNRKVFAFNQFADRWVLKPVAKGYKAITPHIVRRGVGNFFSNLTYPLVAVNQVLQGKFRLGASDTGRFIVNTTIGIGGLFDPASDAGLPAHEEDFGQTFARWGIGSGPFLMLPFLGPSTVRDGVGSAVNYVAQPVRYVIDDEKTRYALAALYFIDTRASLLDAEQLMGGDKYTFMRDAYLQRRDFLIHDGEPGEDDFLNEDSSEE